VEDASVKLAGSWNHSRKKLQAPDDRGNTTYVMRGNRAMQSSFQLFSWASTFFLATPREMLRGTGVPPAFLSVLAQ
jgi:hypothetical protein